MRKYGIHRASTLFYDGLFRSNKTASLTVGVSRGEDYLSLFQNYFTNSVVQAVDSSSYDVIIETTNVLADQIKAVEAACLKPGGLLILENIQNESDRLVICLMLLSLVGDGQVYLH